MTAVKVSFDNGDSLTTSINGTREEILAYYVGRTFNLGTGADGQPEDVMTKAVAVEFLKDT